MSKLVKHYKIKKGVVASVCQRHTQKWKWMMGRWWIETNDPCHPSVCDLILSMDREAYLAELNDYNNYANSKKSGHV